MNFSLETIAKIYAQGRNYINYGLGVATTLGLVSASQDKGLTDSINEMVNGVSQFVHGATSFWQIATVLAAPLVTIFLAKKASNSASTQAQKESLVARAKEPNGAGTEAKAAVLDAVTKLPDVEIQGSITAPPAVASAVPSPQVVAK